MTLRDVMPTVTTEVPLGLRRRAKQDRSRLKMARVLAAASAIIESEGTGALSATRVATRADVSVGWLYTYFDNLEGLMEEIMVAGLQELDTILDDVGFEFHGPDWSIRAEAGIRACVEYFAEHPGFRALWFSQDFSGRMSQANRLHDTLLAGHLAASVSERREDAPGVPLSAVMQIFVGMIDKGIDLAYRDDPVRADDALLHEMQRAAIAYLSAYLI